MEKIIAIFLIVYAVSVIVYFVCEKRFTHVKSRSPQLPEQVPADDIIGKSLYTLSHTKPQAAINQKTELSENKDSIFVPETENKYPMKVPDEKLEDTFSDDPEDKEINVSLEYEEILERVEDEASVFCSQRKRNNFAVGVSIEEITEAVRIVGAVNASEDERMKAGKVFRQIEGNSIYNQFIEAAPQKKKVILEVMGFYLDKQKKVTQRTEISRTDYFDVESVL